MSRPLRLVGSTLLSAALFATAFPPLRLRANAWLALVPFVVALRGTSIRAAVGLGWLWSVAAAYAVGQWLPRAVAHYYQQPQIVGALVFLVVASTMAAPYTIAFALAGRMLLRRVSPLSPVLVGAAWTAAELARGRLFTGSPFFIGNPWALLGYSQVGWAPITQLASVTGIYGVTFVVAVMNAALAQLWVTRGSSAAHGIALAAGIAGAVVLHGIGALRAGPAAEATVPATPVAIVQADLDLGPQWQPAFYGRNLDVYLGYTGQAIAAHHPAIVFWPEGTMTFFLEDEPLYRQTIAHTLGPARVQLVAGGPRSVGTNPPRYMNGIFALSPEGTILGHYDKQYLVPFAEYFPIAGIDFLRRKFERVRVFTAGDPTPPLPTAAGGAGVVTCNEAMLPEIVARRVVDGAAYLVNPTNDSWLADRTYSELQFDIVTMRAIEQRRYLVRASTSGPSAIIDPWGRIQVRTEPLSSGVIAGTVRPRSDRSVYSHVGDAFGLACALATILGLRGRVVARPPSC
ncbi:MAG: apolipoprotein N-acyltransferase [Candidatus Binatia bacterium]